MSNFFSWAISFLIKTVLIVIFGAALLTVAVLCGVEGAWGVMMAGGDLGDIIAIDNYISPQLFLQNTVKVFPLAGVFADMVVFAKVQHSTDLYAHFDLEICKVLLLSVIMWCCEFVRKLICKVADGVCSGLANTGLICEAEWVNKTTSAWCFIFSTYLAVSATTLVALRFHEGLPFHGKVLPAVALLAVCALPFALGGLGKMRTGAISLITKPVCSVVASVCAILAIAVLHTLVYDPSMVLAKAMIALAFLLASAVCIYIATRGTIADFMKL